MQSVPYGEITSAVQTFLRSSDGQAKEEYRRERSWDFCFNHFQENLAPTRTMEHSCLQLGYYLASWGMLRGSSYLFRETNARHYQPTIEVIERYNPKMAELNGKPLFDPHGQTLILAAYGDLRKAILPKGGAALTLVTKIMMGVWGTVPSFDTYFIRGFRSLACGAEKSAFNRIGSRSLTLLEDFYGQNKMEIDNLARLHKTLDFTTGRFTDRPLPPAKIIDMYGFRLGYSAKSQPHRRLPTSQ